MALMVDRNGVLQTASLTSESEGWEGTDTVGNACLIPGSNVAALQQSNSVFMAFVVDSSGVLNVYTIDIGDGQGWRGPESIGSASLVPGANVTAFRQSSSVVTVLTVDRFGVLNGASLDSSIGNGWQGLYTIGGASLVPGSTVSICNPTGSIFMALVVDSTGVLNVASLDLGDSSGWQEFDTVGGAELLPGTRVSIL